MKTKVQPKGPGGTPKPDRKKKVVKEELERIEAINVMTSVERLAGWSADDLKRHLVEEIRRIVSALGGSNGPRFDVSPVDNTIVEMKVDGTWGGIVDIEPMPKGRR